MGQLEGFISLSQWERGHLCWWVISHRVRGEVLPTPLSWCWGSFWQGPAQIGYCTWKFSQVSVCGTLIISGHVQYFVSTHFRASVVWWSYGRITVNLDPKRLCLSFAAHYLTTSKSLALPDSWCPRLQRGHEANQSPSSHGMWKCCVTHKALH